VNIKNIVEKIAARNVREWFAFHGGEELCISLEHASIVWEAAIKSIGKSRSGVCRWKFDEDTFSYHMSCGDEWVFPEGTARENKVRFCPRCGRKIKLVNEQKP